MVYSICMVWLLYWWCAVLGEVA